MSALAVTGLSGRSPARSRCAVRELVRRMAERRTRRNSPPHEADAGAALVNASYLSAGRRRSHQRAASGFFQGAASPLNALFRPFLSHKRNGPVGDIPPSPPRGGTGRWGQRPLQGIEKSQRSVPPSLDVQFLLHVVQVDGQQPRHALLLHIVVAKSALLRFRLRQKLRPLPCSSSSQRTRFAGLRREPFLVESVGIFQKGGRRPYGVT